MAYESLLPKPGDYVAVLICEKNIFVIRQIDDSINGFYNYSVSASCTRIVKRGGNANQFIVCLYHAWTYAIDGSLKAAKMNNKRPSFDKHQFSLREIRVELFCGFVFVNLDTKAESLMTLAGDLAKDINNKLPYIKPLKLCGSDLFG